jgi:hypothetical protein
MWTVAVGVAGTLTGVILGSFLSARTQIRIQMQALRQSELAAPREAYVEYLATLRRFRRTQTVPSFPEDQDGVPSINILPRRLLFRLKSTFSMALRFPPSCPIMNDPQRVG